MNYRGSYRHLLKNSKSAMLAAIELYNKPRIDYRDECFVILLLNAWELLFKSVLSKNGISIFYPKKRNEAYRTLSWNDALNKAEKFFPSLVPHLALRRNLDLLSTYRDNSVHFYNRQGFGVLIYSLAQTSIVNYKDLLLQIFQVDLGEDMNWSLLPLGTKAPLTPIEYISGKSVQEKQDPSVKQFLLELKSAVAEVENAGIDSSRLLTIFSVKLESTKKVEKADIVVGVIKGQITDAGPLAVVRSIDPNISHPNRRKDIVAKIGDIHGVKFTSHVFEAIVWKLNLKNDPIYCWKSSNGFLVKYSNELIGMIKTLKKSQIDNALSSYRDRLNPKRSL